MKSGLPRTSSSHLNFQMGATSLPAGLAGAGLATAAAPLLAAPVAGTTAEAAGPATPGAAAGAGPPAAGALANGLVSIPVRLRRRLSTASFMAWAVAKRSVGL